MPRNVAIYPGRFEVRKLTLEALSRSDYKTSFMLQVEIPVFLLASPEVMAVVATDAQIRKAYIGTSQCFEFLRSCVQNGSFNSRVMKKGIEIYGGLTSCTDHKRPRRKN
jgi:hypothetical protein